MFWTRGMVIVIGLTGNYGMGKSTVACMFRELGAIVIDTDAIVNELFKEPAVIEEIKETFGDDILQDKRVNKKLLADIVFEHPPLRIALEDILHPRVFKAIEKEINRLNSERRDVNSEPITIVEAPVLFERGYQDRFDKIITVFTSEEIAIKRLKEKGIDEDDIRKRAKSQFPVEMKINRSDFAIDNSKDIEYTRKQVEEIYKELRVHGR